MCGLNGGSSAKLYPQSGSAYVHPTTKQCNYSYTHPSTKQCSWSPNLSNYATKSELNELRDLIESSQGPTIVDSGTVSDAANAGKPVYVSISSCNYVVVTLLNPLLGILIPQRYTRDLLLHCIQILHRIYTSRHSF